LLQSPLGIALLQRTLPRGRAQCIAPVGGPCENHVMQNFTFLSPTKIVFGRDTVDAVGRETAAIGKKILIHYGSERKNRAAF
jgi:hypothetical protein